jgi:hypothetical protein
MSMQTLKATSGVGFIGLEVGCTRLQSIVMFTRPRAMDIMLAVAEWSFI